MASVTSRGYSIRYESSGDGPAIVLVPGFTQWADQWLSAGYVDELQKAFRVIRIDPLGHGLSDKPHDAQAYRWTDVIDDLVAVADAEGLERAMWWGFSRGAYLVQDLAHLFPQRVSAAVFGSSVQTFGTDIDFDWLTLGDQLRAGDDGLVRLWTSLGFTDPDGVEFGKSMNDCDALAGVFEGQFIDEPPEYDQWHVPTLAYKGGLEGYSLQVADLFNRSDTSCYEVDRANHSETFERSADVLPFVMPFLERNAAAQRDTAS